MRKVIVVILAVLVLTVGMAVPAFAATTQDVTITAQPAYITISNTPATWTLNGIYATGDGVTPKNYIAPSDTYYANPLGDGTPPSATVLDTECQFTVDPTGSSLHVDLKVDCSAFTGGGATMTTTADGVPTATGFGGFSWYSGMTTYSASKVIMKVSGSSALKTDLGEATTLKWGAEILTRTNAWTQSGNSTATMTMTATAHPD